MSDQATATPPAAKPRKPRTVKPTKIDVIASAAVKGNATAASPTPLAPVFVGVDFKDTKAVRKYVEADGAVEALIKKNGWPSDATVSFVTFRQIDGFSAAVVVQRPKTLIS